MTNKDRVTESYNEIHAPDALRRKVMNMNKEKKNKVSAAAKAAKLAVGAAAAIAITVVASNGICYAATGESLLSRIKILMNGETVEQDVNIYADGHAGAMVPLAELGPEKELIFFERDLEYFYNRDYDGFRLTGFVDENANPLEDPVRFVQLEPDGTISYYGELDENVIIGFDENGVVNYVSPTEGVYPVIAVQD